MNVRVISHLFPNRAEPLKGVFVLEKARALFRHLPTQVVAPVSYFPLLRRYANVPREDELEGLRIYHPRYLALPEMLFYHRWRPYYHALRSTLDRIAPAADVYQVDWVYPDAAATIRYARRTCARVFLTIHGYNAVGLFHSPDQSGLYRDALLAADGIIAVSRDLKSRIVERFGIEEGKITVIHNGIDVTKFSPGSRDYARRCLGIPVNRPVIITVARLSEEKALATMIKAMTSIEDRDVQLYILGEGPLRSHLANLIGREELENRVFLMGGIPHEELNAWFNAADLFCLSSLHEGCPVVVHEALACGIPVVSTTVGAVPDIVTSSDYGLLCVPNDPAQLARQLTAALSRSWDRDAIAAYGRKFTWDKVARETIQFYQQESA